MSAKHKPRARVLTVSVTQDIIDRAIPKDSGVCMIAEAIRESFPDASNISVDIQTCRVTDKKRGLRYIYITPRSAGLALLQFDQEIKPEPFSLTLKNGHVLRAGKKDKNSSDDGLTKVSLRKSRSGNNLERVGGKAPPRLLGKGMGALKRRRIFGMRAGADPASQSLISAESMQSD